MKKTEYIKPITEVIRIKINENIMEWFSTKITDEEIEDDDDIGANEGIFDEDDDWFNRNPWND